MFFMLCVKSLIRIVDDIDAMREIAARLRSFVTWVVAVIEFSPFCFVWICMQSTDSDEDES